MNNDETQLRKTASLEGYWTSNNSSTKTLQEEDPIPTETLASEITVRRSNSVTVKVDNKVYQRYFFIAKIHTGIAQNSRPIPKNNMVNLTFNRADAEKALVCVALDADDKGIGEYPHKTIKIVNPVLEACFVNSEYYDRKYADHRISRVNFPFTDTVIRRELLNEGVADHNINLSEGPAPIAYAFALIKPEKFKGTLETSTTKFSQNFLDSFDLQLDGRSISGYPISKCAGLATDFYYRFQKECNFYDNAYSSGCLSYDSFKNDNFIIVENLKRKNIFNGHLTLKLRFMRNLEYKVYLIAMPVYQKKLNIDEFHNVCVSEMHANDADKIQEEDYN